MEFGNPIVGSEDLIRSAIKSPDFNTDPESGNVTGWRIARDGSATFYNLTIGSTNFNIDEQGNAVFQEVSANSIILDGTSLADTLALFPRGVLAVSIAPTAVQTSSSGQFAFNRITFSNWDPSRQVKVGVIGQIDKMSAAPNYVNIWAHYAWNGTATLSSPLLYQFQYGTGAANGNDEMFNIVHTFSNSSQALGDTLDILFAISAPAFPIRYAPTSFGRAWIEDAGPRVEYTEFVPSGGGGTTPTQYVKTYAANASASFQQDGTNRGVAELYQGRYSATNGNQFSMIGFPYSTIQSDLSGATINKVELYLDNVHFYSNSGGKAIIGTHNQTSVSGNHSSSQINANLSSPTFTYGQAKWVTLPNSIGNAFRDNTAKGIALGPGPSTSQTYYGYFRGSSQSGKPQLRITYTK